MSKASADAGRQELDPAELSPANLKLAGQVLDADDKPVAGIYVNLYGENQPNGNTRTDREGGSASSMSAKAGSSSPPTARTATATSRRKAGTRMSSSIWAKPTPASPMPDRTG